MILVVYGLVFPDSTTGWASEEISRRPRTLEEVRALEDAALVDATKVAGRRVSSACLINMIPFPDHVEAL